LCGLLAALNFDEQIAGSHHTFTRPGTANNNLSH
jgi:hypothetical protein